MGAAASNTLAVPGATLYYETRGAGPMFLLIGGGPTDASAFEGLAAALASRFTVVSYDPRGNSRSKLDGPPSDQWVETHADDAHRLLGTLGTEPAYVLGDGTGALVGLELVIRQPAQVHTLVAFEPPALDLLPDADALREDAEALYDTYRRDGAPAAMAAWRHGPATAPVPTARTTGNFAYYVEHVLLPFGDYRVDVAALAAASTRIVVATAPDPTSRPAGRAALALAASLGKEAVTLPGPPVWTAAFADALAPHVTAA
jgi:pimeloyl-ACP methyl ester carboxylesterase